MARLARLGDPYDLIQFMLAEGWRLRRRNFFPRRLKSPFALRGWSHQPGGALECM